jgi:type IV pilus assembly protein PilC
VALSFFVIPTFEEIFADFGLTLPGLTVIVIKLAKWITSGQAILHISVGLAIAAILVVVLRNWLASPGNWASDRFGRRFARSTAIAKLAGFTADLLEAGFDRSSALTVAAFANRASSFRRVAHRFAESLRNHAQIDPLDTRHLSATIAHALVAEMPTSSRVRLLQEISDCYADRSGRLSSWSRGLAAPLATIAVGLLVGLMVLGLLVPLISLIENLSSAFY